jgi:tetratricopeptide (TPR) repeat protein
MKRRDWIIAGATAAIVLLAVAGAYLLLRTGALGALARGVTRLPGIQYLAGRMGDGPTAADPQAAEWLETGAAAEERGEYQEAIQAYEQALEEAPGESQAYLGLASAYEELGDREQALVQAQRAAELAPEDAEALRVLGRLQCMTGDFAACAETLEDAIRLDPENAQGHYLLALAYQQDAQGDLDRAVREHQEALRFEPQLAVSHLAIAEMYAQRPGYEPLAIEAYQEAARVAHDIGQAEVEARAYAGMARLYYRQDQYQQCIDTWQRALEVSPEDPDAHRRLGLCYAMRAQEGDLQRAVDAMERALVLDYGQIDAYYFFLGQYYASQEEWLRAMLAWDQFLRFSDDEERNELVRGWMERYRQSVEEEGP